jgi:EthD domain
VRRGEALRASRSPEREEQSVVVKSIGLLTRRDGLTHEEFVKHWFEVHAPLAHAVPGVIRYVQSHIL